MKKIKYLSLLLIVFLLLTGCSSNKKNTTKKEKKKTVETQEKEEKPEVKEEEKYIDDNPITIGLYEDYYSLIKDDYYTEKTSLKDLFFSAFYTNDETIIDGYVKNRWLNYYNQYTDIENYKIGYNISFDVGDKHYDQNITEITDEFIFEPYFYVYLYDDVHQEIGAWYSHLTKNDVQDFNLFTSIKLYLVEVDKITSPITLTVFTYDSEDDFDEDGNYRGNSKYQINIKWK